MALAAGGPVVRDARARARRGAVCGAHAVSARPGPDRALEAVPPAEGEDTGLHRPSGRSLPHADDAYAGDDGDLARRRPRARAERGSDRGDRAGARSGSHAVRPRGRGRARCGVEVAVRAALPAQRTVAPDRAKAQPDPRGLRRDPDAHGAGRAGDARGAHRAARRPRRVHQPRHRRRPPLRAARRGRPAARRDRVARLRAAAGASTGSSTTWSRLRPRQATSARARRSAVPCIGCATSCSSASTLPMPPARSTAARTRRSSGSSPTSSTAATRADQIVEYVAGMTDRFALAYAERLDS